MFTVRARDTGGNISAVSQRLTVVLADTGDVTPPAAPTGLTARPTSRTSAAACCSLWGRSAGAVEYEIYRNGGVLRARG